ETDLDDVLQIANVFVNVSKGEVAKTGDMQKAFGTADVKDIIKEVHTDFAIVYLQRSMCNVSRSSRKANSKSVKRSAIMILTRCAKKLPPSWPKNVWSQ